MRAPAAAAAALAAILGGASPAAAQDVPNVISPLRVESDHNGVNLVNGKTAMQGPGLSAPGAGNLRFDRVQNAAPYVLGKISGSGEYVHGNYSVHSGQGTEAFNCQDDVCTSVTGTGSGYLINVNTFTQAGTGAVWRFDLKHQKTVGLPTNTIQYYASSITYANGETISFSYDTATLPGDPRVWHRPTQLTSNLGYAIAIAYKYSGSDLNDPLWGSPAEVKLYNLSAPATPLARLVYGSETITQYGTGDTIGRVSSCTGCSNALGSPIETVAGSLTLPGESSPTLEVSALPGAPGIGGVVGSVVKDGVAWTYGYANLTYHAQSNSHHYTNLTVDGPDGFHQVYDVVQAGTPTQRRNVVTRSTDSIGRTTRYTFDPAYRPIRIVAPEGNSVEIAYDTYGNIVSRKAIAKQSELDPVTETAFYPEDDWNLCGIALKSPRCYRPLWSRDGLNRQTDYVWNDGGQLMEQTDPADVAGVRRKTYISYEPGTLSRKSVVRVCGDVTTCGTPNENRTEYQYWGSTFLPSRERRFDAARGITLDTLYTYDSAGRLLSTDGPLPASDDATYNRYDAHGRKIWEIGPRGADGLRVARRTEYRDSDDKVLTVWTGTVTDPASATLAAVSRSDVRYDERRNPSREFVSEASGTTRTVLDRSFDQSGRAVCETRRMNMAAFNFLPGDACTASPAGAHGADRITRNAYDEAGQLLEVHRAWGTPLHQIYAAYEYTGNGKRRAVTDANGNRAEMIYDGHDRQRCWIFPSRTSPGALGGDCDTGAGDFEAYGYDRLGNRTSLRKRDGTSLGFQYDGLNRVIVKTVPASASGAAGYSVHYAYDVNGLQTEARFGSAAGPGVSNGYDGFGRPISARTNMDGTLRTLLSEYDSGSRRTILWDNGVSYSGAYQYDGAGRTTVFLEAFTTLAIRYGYDPLGRRSTLGLGAGWVSSAAGYGYDSIGRLDTLTRDLAGDGADQSLGFAYNTASQIVTRTSSNDAFAVDRTDVSRSYGVNGLNQYSSVAVGGVPTTYQYDANGNLRWDGFTTYVYDAENRLVSASGARNATLAYDPLGRLWQISGPAGTTRFLYDGDALIQERDGNGNLLRAYVHGPGTDEPLMWYEYTAGFSRRFLHADHQGSIVAAADSNGTLIAINAYDAWGVPDATGLELGRFGYTGQAWLPELGMYYYKARLYSPILGRFLQTDPIGYEDQVNLYTYVGNDPVNMTDPTGEDGGCIYSPGQCGMRQLTPQEEERRDQAYWAVGTFVVTVAPVGRLFQVAAKGWTVFQAWRFVRSLSPAFRAAAAGGRHAPLVRQFSQQATRSVNSTVRNLTRRIEEHQEKIRNPAAHMTRDDPRDAAAVQRAIKDWKDEIKNYSEQRDIARDTLRLRAQGCTGSRLCF